MDNQVIESCDSIRTYLLQEIEKEWKNLRENYMIEICDSKRWYSVIRPILGERLVALMDLLMDAAEVMARVDTMASTNKIQGNGLSRETFRMAEKVHCDLVEEVLKEWDSVGQDLESVVLKIADLDKCYKSYVREVFGKHFVHLADAYKNVHKMVNDLDDLASQT